MHFASAFLLASSAAIVAAAPASIKVTEDDVILYGKGRFTMMKRSEFAELEAARNSDVAPPKPGYLDSSLYTVSGNQTYTPTENLEKRAGDTIIVPNPSARFLGWDTLMSAIVKGAPTDIAVSAGYSVSNSISVGVGAEFSIIENFLSASMSIDYTQSWESSQSQQFTAKVPEGKYGAFVSNAWTHRESGNIWRGKIGGEGSLTYYQGDSFDSRSFGNLNWVDGVIALCTGDSFPLKRCLGEETL